MYVWRQPELKLLLKFLKQVWTDPYTQSLSQISTVTVQNFRKSVCTAVCCEYLWMFRWYVYFVNMHTMYYFSEPKFNYLKACCKLFGQSDRRDSSSCRQLYRTRSHLHRNRKSHRPRNHKQRLLRLYRRCRKCCFLLRTHFWHLSKCSRKFVVPFRNQSKPRNLILQ